MKRKLLSLCLAFCMLFAAVVPVMTPRTYAAEEDTADDPGEEEPREPIVLRTTEAGIAMIKKFEGFLLHPIVDGSQYSVGYGSRCASLDDYPDGITEEEADYLLRQYVQKFEASLDAFLAENGLTLTDTEYDALISFTYNLGTGWMKDGYTFSTMLKNGLSNYTDLQIINAMAVWSHFQGSVLKGLVDRRLQEAMLLLYGDYGTGEVSTPEYRYLILKPGENAKVSADVLVYASGASVTAVNTPTNSDDAVFLGWFTAAEGGTKLSFPLTLTKNTTIYAQWETPEPGITFEDVLPPEVPDTYVNRFPDVSKSDWFYPYVAVLTAEGVVNGCTDGKYHPGNNVTWGEALKLVMLAAGFPAETNAKSGHWASNYLAAAREYGILDPAKAVNLSAAITRQEIAELIVHALWLEPSSADTPFADTEDVCVIAAAAAGILQGSIDSATGLRNYRPNANLTRAEVATIIWRVMDYATPEAVG